MNADRPTATEVKPSDLVFRWVDEYYDGVLSGFATWQGKLCYFHVSDAATWPWKYTIHRLSDQEAETASREYEEFRALYGDHNDLLPDGNYAGGTSRGTVEEGAAAGDAIAAAMAAGTWQPPASFRNNPIIGWFRSVTF